MNNAELKILTNSVFEDWVRVGVRFSGTQPAAKEPLMEKLVAQTSIVCRYWPRLFDVMAGWIQMHGDLINVPLMYKYLADSDTAVIGVLCDILTSCEATNFKKLTKYCSPKKAPEMLFLEPKEYYTLENIRYIVPAETANIIQKWNLYYLSVKIKTNATFLREGILKHNPNLARRAMLGANMKTEILNYLLSKKSSSIAEIAAAVKHRLEKITGEVNILLADGFLTATEKEIGPQTQVTLTPSFVEYLQSINNIFTPSPPDRDFWPKRREQVLAYQG
jgi:hypothetical protein